MKEDTNEEMNEDTYLPYRDSSGSADDATALHARMAEDGYLFLPGLLPGESVAAVRDAVLGLCRDAGWADDAGRPAGRPRLEGQEGWWEVYDPLQKTRAFHALAHHPRLLGAVARLLSGAPAVLVHPRNIGRITFPGATHFTTPAHQDFPLIQGTPDTYTAWLPLADCPMRLGGLAMLRGSHRFGMLPMRPAVGPGGVEADTRAIEREEGLTWHAQDLKAGDVLLFHSHTVHRALPNRTADGLRLSADYRYQDASAPVVAHSLEPHYGRLSWEQVYADWPEGDDLRYYWRRLPGLAVVEHGGVRLPAQAAVAAVAAPPAGEVAAR